MGYQSPLGADSMFADSLFGQSWEKNLPMWARAFFENSLVLPKSYIVIADFNSKVTHSQADSYNALIASRPPKYSFKVYAHPDGVKVLEMYNDSRNTPSSDYEVLVFIETDDGRFDFGRIVRAKFGKKVVDDLKNKYFRELPWKDNDPKDIAEKFIISAWRASNDPNYNAAEKDVQANIGNIRNLLIEAIEYEYDQQKFDDLSWFIIALKGVDYIISDVDDVLFDYASWIRTKKYTEEKYWNGALPDNVYSPAFIPDILIIQDQSKRENLLKAYLTPVYSRIRSYIKEQLSSNNPFISYAYDVSIGLIASIEAFTDSIAGELARIYIPEGSYLTYIKHMNAFYVGLWNGILELLAAIVELLALVFLFFTGELGFRIGDQLRESFENFMSDLWYNTEETIKKAFEAFIEAFFDFADWYNHYDGVSYQILKEIGELVPEVLTWIIPELKASKLAKAQKIATGMEAKALSEAQRKVLSRELRQEIETGNARKLADDAAKGTQEKIVLKTRVSDQRRLVNDIDDGTLRLDEFPDGRRRKAGDYTRYSNYAEMKADLYFESNTFTIGESTGTLRRISLERVRDLDNGIPKGIDGVYEFSSPPPKYVITEVKMNTKGGSGWKPTVDKTVTKSGGKQMTDTWVNYNLDLEFGPVKAMEIQIEGYEKVLIGISKQDVPILHILDKDAKILKNNIIKRNE